MQTLNQTTEQVNYLELIKTQSALYVLNQELIDANINSTLFFPRLIKEVIEYTNQKVIDSYIDVEKHGSYSSEIVKDKVTINTINFEFIGEVNYNYQGNLGFLIDVFYNNQLIFEYIFDDYQNILGEILSSYYYNDNNNLVFNTYVDGKKPVVDLFQVRKDNVYDLFKLYLSNNFLNNSIKEELINDCDDNYNFYHLLDTTNYKHNNECLVTIDDNFRNFKLSYSELLKAPYYYKWFYYIDYKYITTETINRLLKDYDGYLPKYLLLNKLDDLIFDIEYISYGKRNVITKQLDFSKDLYSELQLDFYTNFFNILVNANKDWDKIISKYPQLVITRLVNTDILNTKEFNSLEDDILYIFETELDKMLINRTKIVKDIYSSMPINNIRPRDLYANIIRFIEFLIFKR